MKTFAPQSILAPALLGLAGLRQALGHEDQSFHQYLAQFDRFLCTRQWMSPYLTRELVEAWVACKGPLRPKTRAARMHAMRALGRYIAQTHPETYIPGPTWGERQTPSFHPHIYSPAELRALLEESAHLGTPGSLRAKTYVTLFCLLASTGLRISEALALTLADVDLEEGLLIVRESKFHKSRALPLHTTAIQPLKDYRAACARSGNTVRPDAPFFVNEWKRPLAYGEVHITFLKIARRSGLRRSDRRQGPRIHDLRHFFATTRLLLWYQDGQDVGARLPLLTTYMGHVSIASTQVYLEATAELLGAAAARFTSPRLNDVPSLSSGGSQ